VAGAIAAAAAAWSHRPRALAVLLGAALVVQAADIRPPLPFELRDERPSAAAGVLTSVRGRYRHVALVPPFLLTGDGRAASDACPPAWATDAYVTFANAAHRIGATINSAYLARIDASRAASTCRALAATVASGRLDPATLYVVHPAYAGSFRAMRAACGPAGGALLCARDEDVVLAAALARAR
jgi:hypothetical protein